MRFCPDCGTGHECEAEQPRGSSDAVRIAEIERDRDIALAKLSARQTREVLDTEETIAEMETDAEVVAAVAEAEVLGDVIDAQTPDAPEAEPLIINAPEATAEETVDDAPPVVEQHETETESETPRKRTGLGMW